MKKLYITLSCILPALLFAEIDKPSNLIFEDITENSVVITWKDRSLGETGYKIYRDGQLLSTTGKNVTSFKDSGLLPNHNYRYEIKATDDEPLGSTINSTVDNYSPADDSLSFELYNLQGKAKDWIGVFRVGDELKRGNLLAWGYTNSMKNGELTIDTIYPNDGHLSEGKYQAVLFYNDSYVAENRSYFDVKEAVDYGKEGKFPVKIYNGTNYNVYHSEDVKNAPVVVFLSGAGANIREYRAFMKFIASHGYYVIGLSDSYYHEDNVNLLNLLKDAKNYQNYADTSRVTVMGHSLGGAYAFYALKALKAKEYGLKRNSIIELDGWFALLMTDNDMKNIDTSSLIIQYGGVGSQEYVGGNIGNFQDPKINLAVYYMLRNNEKALRVIDANTHGYQSGGLDQYEALLQKQDLLRPIDTFLRYTLKDDNDAKNISLRDDYKGVEDYIHTHEEANYSYGCQYYNKDVNDYCDLNHIRANRVWWDR